MNEINGNRLWNPFLPEMTADQILFWWFVCISCIAFVWWKQKRGLSSYVGIIISSTLLASIISWLTRFIFSRNTGGAPEGLMFGWPKAYMIYREGWSMRNDMLLVTFVSWFFTVLAIIVFPQLFFYQSKKPDDAR